MEITYNGKRYRTLEINVKHWIEKGYMEEIKEEPTDLEARYEKYMSKADREEYEQDLNALGNSLEKEYDKSMDEIHGVVDVLEVKRYDEKNHRLAKEIQIETLTKAVLQLQKHVFNK